MRFIGLFLFLFVEMFPLFGQKPKVDSLQKVLKNWEKKANFETDTNYIGLLNKFIYGLAYDTPDSALLWAERTRKFSEKITYRAGIIENLRAKGFAFANKGNYGMAEKCYLEAIEIGKKTNELLSLFNLEYSLAGNYNQQARTQEALMHLNQALQIAKKTNYSDGKALCLNMIGNIYRAQGNYALALEHSLESYRLYTNMKNQWGIGWSLSSIAGIYSKQQNYEEALRTYQEILKLKEQNEDWEGIAWSLNSIGALYKQQKKYSEALENHRKSLNLALSKKLANQTLFAYNYTNTAEVYFAQKNYNLVFFFLQKAHESNQVKREKGVQVVIEDLFARTYWEIKDYAAAFEYAQKTLKIAQKVNYKEYLQKSHEILSKIYKEQKRYDSALWHYERFKLYADSLRSIEIEQKTIILQTQYEHERRENALKAEQAKKDAEYARQKMQTTWLIFSILAGLILLVVILYLIFRSRKKIQTAYNLLKVSNQEIERKSREIHASITYAFRIQNAIIPKEAKIQKRLDCFVLFRPRDIVSGDFYWFAEKVVVSDRIREVSQKPDYQHSTLANRHYILAVADCTGHGVSGAFMTMIGNTILNQLIHDYSILSPDQILNKIPILLNKVFRHAEKDMKDGMDIAIVTIQGKKIGYAGAKIPLYYVHNQEISKIKADRVAIYSKNEEDFQYQKHEVVLDQRQETSNSSVSTDHLTLYLCSDGFQDQFGGQRNRKFMSAALQNLFLEISEKPMSEQKERLEQTLEAWKGKNEQTDDVLVVGVRV